MRTATPTTLTTFCAAAGITSTATRAASNPQMEQPFDGASHWRVTLRLGRRQFTVPFSMGAAHHGEPTTVNVLDCLLSDASGYDNASSFEDWAGDYGYDTDSRRAERTYQTVARQSDKLRTFLGDDYDTAIACERE